MLPVFPRVGPSESCDVHLPQSLRLLEMPPGDAANAQLVQRFELALQAIGKLQVQGCHRLSIGASDWWLHVA